MALLWVIPSKLFARVTHLLDHEVLPVLFHDALDPDRFVSRYDNEPESLLDDSLVLRRGDGKLFNARSVAAFAVERQRSFDVVPFRAVVDPLVDSPEDLFIPGSGFCELHAVNDHTSDLSPVATRPEWPVGRSRDGREVLRTAR